MEVVKTGSVLVLFSPILLPLIGVKCLIDSIEDHIHQHKAKKHGQPIKSREDYSDIGAFKKDLSALFRHRHRLFHHEKTVSSSNSGFEYRSNCRIGQ